MMISERSIGTATVLDLEGPFTSSDGANQLRDTVRRLLQQDHKRIVVNLGAVPYMDSTGLGELVQACASARRQGGELKLINVTKRLRDLFVVTKLANIFDLFDSENAAVGSFQ